MGGEVTEKKVCENEKHVVCGETGDGFWEEEEVINLWEHLDEVKKINA